MLKAKEIREMSEDEIEKKLNDLRLELMKERAKITIGGVPENPGRVKEIKKAIARILTIRKEMKNRGV